MNKKIMVALAALVLAASPVAGQGTTAPPAARIAVVNQDRVLNESEEGKRLKADLEKLRVQKQATIEGKEKEIKALQDQILNAQLSLSDDKREDLSRQLKRKRVEYERLSDDASAEFQEAANRAQARLIVQFRDLIGKYGTEKGYTVIFEKNAVYFAADAVDITDELLARFNQSAGAAGPPAAKN